MERDLPKSMERDLPQSMERDLPKSMEGKYGRKPKDFGQIRSTDFGGQVFDQYPEDS